MAYIEGIQFNDSANIDSFSRLRVSEPTTLFELTQLYDNQPLIMESITTSAGSAVYDSTNKCTDFSATAGGSSASMQSYKWIRYQPGKSQLAIISFKFGAASGYTERVGLFDGTYSGSTETIGNGFFLERAGSTVTIKKYKAGSATTVAQASWNIDTMLGTGISGKTLDLTKTCLLVIDAQWLGVGRVRIGFDIDGQIFYVHEFLHANIADEVYSQTLTLPIRMSTNSSPAGQAYTAGSLICATVMSEGGNADVSGYSFSVGASVTAASGARTHALSIQPKTTFNSIANRSELILESVEVLAGSNPVLCELCIGTAVSGTTAFSDVNTTYSGVTYNTAGTLSTGPTIVIAQWHAGGSATSKESIRQEIKQLYPITLTSAGALRTMGRLTLLLTGISGTSACTVAFNWRELR